MTELICIGYLLVFFFAGQGIARYLFPDERPIRRAWLGGAFGFGMLVWYPALFAFIQDFTLLTQILALLLACITGTLFFWLSRKRTLMKTPWRKELPILLACIPLLLVCAWLLVTHTIVPKDGSLWVGQSTYGDLAMHLGFISSIAVQKTFPPMYSICPDTIVGYPFLSESCGATFMVLGASLRFATVLSALYAFALVIFGVYFFFEAWLTTKRKAIFSTLLFFIGGGFGFWYFFDLTKLDPNNFTRFIDGFYETPTNFVEYGLRWVNPIADMMIPQRALLFGWALLFPCLFLLYRAVMERDTRLFLPLGILASTLPLIHTHSFLALGIISGYYFVRSVLKNEGWSQWRGYIVYLAAVLLFAGPQLLQFTFPQGSGSVHLHWNWANNADNYIWFYIKNFGLLAVLLPVAFLEAKRSDRGFFSAAFLLWAVVEIIQFQPNEYDNNKLLFIWFAYVCGLVGSMLVNWYERGLHSSAIKKASVRVLAAMCCIVLFTSGVMTLIREGVSEYQLIDPDSVEAAEYVKANTAPDATFLTSNNHNNCVAALTGRNIICGSGTFLFFHGVDYSEREQALPLLYEEPAYYFDALSEKYNIDYVLLGSYERYNYAVDEAYFDANFPIVFTNNSVKIYRAE